MPKSSVRVERGRYNSPQSTEAALDQYYFFVTGVIGRTLCLGHEQSFAARRNLAVTMRKKQIKAKAKRQRAVMKAARVRASKASGAVQEPICPCNVRFTGAIQITVAPTALSILVARDKDGNELVPGDHIRKEMSIEAPLGAGYVPYWHDGLYLGRTKLGDFVIHYSGNAGPESTGKVEIVPVEQFGEWYEIEVVPHPSPKFDRRTSVLRALCRYQENEYSLVSNNCQHFVNWCIEGENRSKQVDIAIEMLPELIAVFFKQLGAGAMKILREELGP
jgi:hypothetical protein